MEIKFKSMIWFLAFSQMGVISFDQKVFSSKKNASEGITVWNTIGIGNLQALQLGHIYKLGKVLRQTPFIFQKEDRDPRQERGAMRVDMSIEIH